MTCDTIKGDFRRVIAPLPDWRAGVQGAGAGIAVLGLRGLHYGDAPPRCRCPTRARCAPANIGLVASRWPQRPCAATWPSRC
eukprot:9144504-Pyramimonas_sp.AAC.1